MRPIVLGMRVLTDAVNAGGVAVGMGVGVAAGRRGVGVAAGRFGVGVARGRLGVAVACGLAGAAAIGCGVGAPARIAGIGLSAPPPRLHAYAPLSNSAAPRYRITRRICTGVAHTIGATKGARGAGEPGRACPAGTVMRRSRRPDRRAYDSGSASAGVRSPSRRRVRDAIRVRRSPVARRAQGDAAASDS